WRLKCWLKPDSKCSSLRLVRNSIRRKAICSNGIMTLRDGDGVRTGLLASLTPHTAAGRLTGNLTPGTPGHGSTGSARVCWADEPITGGGYPCASGRV